MSHWKDSVGLWEYKCRDEASAICPGETLAAAISPEAAHEWVFLPLISVGFLPSAVILTQRNVQLKIQVLLRDGGNLGT